MSSPVHHGFPVCILSSVPHPRCCFRSECEMLESESQTCESGSDRFVLFDCLYIHFWPWQHRLFSLLLSNQLGSLRCNPPLGSGTLSYPSIIISSMKSLAIEISNPSTDVQTHSASGGVPRNSRDGSHLCTLVRWIGGWIGRIPRLVGQWIFWGGTDEGRRTLDNFVFSFLSLSVCAMFDMPCQVRNCGKVRTGEVQGLRSAKNTAAAAGLRLSNHPRYDRLRPNCAARRLMHKRWMESSWLPHGVWTFHDISHASEILQYAH